MRRAIGGVGVALAAILGQAPAAALSTWTPEAPMTTARSQHASVLLDDGSVAVFGGVNSSGLVLDAEHLSNGAWTSIGTVGITGNLWEGVVLASGKVVVRADGSQTARVYEPSTQLWTSTGEQSLRRIKSTMTLLPDGKVLLAGGAGSKGLTLGSAELYDPATNTWVPTGSMSEPRNAHSAVLLQNGKVLVVAGNGNSGHVATAEIYDPTSGSWTLAASPLVPRHYASLTLLPDGRVLLAGGYAAAGVVAHAEIYDPVANTWTATGAMLHPRNAMAGTPFASGVVLPTGQVLVSGGGDGTVTPPLQAELYDPALGTWALAGELANGRENGSAHLLPTGDVLVAGGFDLKPALTFYNTVERYTPAVPPGPLPGLAALAPLQAANVPWTVAGTGFTGGAGTSTPQLQIQRVENGAITRVSVLSDSATSLTAAAVGTVPAGLYMVRVVVDGVPSAAQLVRFVDAVGTPSVQVGMGQATVNWAAPAHVGGNTVEGYSVTSQPASAGCTAVAGATSCVVTGLDTTTAYSFLVQAQHATGAGPVSAPSASVVPFVNEFSDAAPGGAGTVTASVTGGGPTCRLVAADTAMRTPPPGAPTALPFPYGVFQFRAAGCTHLSTLQVSLTYPQPLPAQVAFWKYGPDTPGAASVWFEFPGATLSADRRTVSYSITDNGVGDGDSTNGVVFDPLGAVFAAAPVGGVQGVPGLAPAGVALTSLLIALACFWRGKVVAVLRRRL